MMSVDLTPNQERELERELVLRARRGDEKAFEQLIDHFTPALYKVVRRMASDDLEAQVIVQETFLRLWRGLGSLSDDRPFLPYLVTIALNIGRDQWRRSRFLDFSGLTGAEENLPADEISPEDQVTNQELLSRLARAVANLPGAYRAVIAMRYDAEMSYQEMAQALNLPINTVRTHIHRAKAALRQALEKEEKANG